VWIAQILVDVNFFYVFDRISASCFEAHLEACYRTVEGTMLGRDAR